MIWRLGLVVVICTVAIAEATDWRSKKAFELEESAFAKATVGPKESAARYVSYDLDYAPFEKLRIDLEARLKLKLENRGEAHITIVTPPEFSKLAEVLKPEEIHHQIQQVLSKEESPQIERVCLGQGTLRHGLKGKEQTWFLVVKFPAALEAREKLAEEFEKRMASLPAPKSSAVFKAREFYPHVTLGFVGRDLHLQDGVIKNISSCKFPIGQKHHSERH